MSNCLTAEGCENQFKRKISFPNPEEFGCQKTWHIKHGDQECYLDQDLAGLGFIQEIIGSGENTAEEILVYQGAFAPDKDEIAQTFQTGDPGCARFKSEDRRERDNPGYGIDHGLGKMLDGWAVVIPSKIRSATEEWNREAKAALASGDQPRYDELMLQVSRARAYLSDTTGLGGRSRNFLDQRMRDTDAVRKAIDRAIAAIRKQAPALADYFKSTIMGSNGRWAYADADTTRWDTEDDNSAWLGPNPEAEDESEIEWPRSSPQEDPEVLEIRRSWLSVKDDHASMQAAILNFQSQQEWGGKWGVEENLKSKIGEWEKTHLAEQAAKTPAELTAETFHKNQKLYAGRDKNFIIETTRQEVRSLIARQVSRKHAPTAPPWWEPKPSA